MFVDYDNYLKGKAKDYKEIIKYLVNLELLNNELKKLKNKDAEVQQTNTTKDSKSCIKLQAIDKAIKAIGKELVIKLE